MIESGPTKDQLAAARQEIPPTLPVLVEVVPGPINPLAQVQMLPRYSRKRLVLALIIASISDMLSVLVEFVPPLQLIVDVLTAVLLFMVLGWRWLLLPALIAEAIPGISIFPIWLLVVISIAVAGNTRR